MANERRVVITGMGVLSSVGTGIDEFWRGLVSGRNGIGRLTRFDATGYASTMASEVRDFDPERWIDRKSAGRMDRFTQFAVAAAGAVEFIATVMSVSTGIVPPTINYREPDPGCPLDYVPGRAESIDLKAALSNSFGFGGGNACLAVTKIGSER